MAQATRLGEMTFGDHVERAIREVAMWAMMVVAVYLAVALVSYSPDDPGWSYVGPSETVANPAGPVGAWFSDVTLALFGVFAYLVPVAVAWSAYLVFRNTKREGENRVYVLAIRWLGLLLTVAAGTAFVTLHFGSFGDLAGLLPNLPNGVGGGLGLLLRDAMVAAFNPKGTSFLLTGVLFVGTSLFAGVSWVAVMDAIGGAIFDSLSWVRARVVAGGVWARGLLQRLPRPEPAEREEPQIGDDTEDETECRVVPATAAPGPKARRREPRLFEGAMDGAAGPPKPGGTRKPPGRRCPRSG